MWVILTFCLCVWRRLCLYKPEILLSSEHTIVLASSVYDKLFFEVITQLKVIYPYIFVHQQQILWL